ncbi:(2Fe-2S)-binding protein [Caenimonas sedimenti]|uniref:(2Fe-2S)-binding protein n=1 Tax=Caenimonas sedimenti TaxID=2596921 RepID=A0A562ZQK9_9BURK|nr:(2Fe-2S)-binding protein [Caenimonas sedimenti]TWO70677.1 (2Fe-2S)-binding protein [Caenimonas sedimenti]
MPRRIKLQFNGCPVQCDVADHTTLAELIRDGLGAMGTKVACNQAACGACTVVLDDEAVFACHTLAAQADGGVLQTIEGLASGGTLHPLQQAFIEHDALQCGFCTPGMLMTLKASFDAGVPADRDRIARAISGNICRCGAYPSILDAACDAFAQRA